MGGYPTHPVVRRLSFTVDNLAILPDVVVRVGMNPIHGSCEPPMFITGVIGDEIHDQFNTWDEKHQSFVGH